MFPAAFEYKRAGSVEEALALLAEHPDAKLLAGGHTLIPMLKLRLAHPGTVIDIGRIEELRGICRSDDGVTIGALATHAEIAASAELAETCPMLPEAAAQIGDPQVRNKGTIGGNVAHADPASDLPAALVAVGATLRLRGPDGERRVAAAEFFVDLLTTALGPGEILVGVDVPTLTPGCGCCYLKVEHPASGYAVCGAAAVLTIDGGRCTRAGLAFNGVTATPHLAQAVGDALVGTAADDAAIDQAIGHLAIADPLGDLHASGEYRVALAEAYGRRALRRARDRALS